MKNNKSIIIAAISLGIIIIGIYLANQTDLLQGRILNLNKSNSTVMPNDNPVTIEIKAIRKEGRPTSEPSAPGHGDREAFTNRCLELVECILTSNCRNKMTAQDYADYESCVQEGIIRPTVIR